VFNRKLVLSITSLSIVGLIIVYIIVNTIFRTIIYENVVEATHSEARLIAQEVDNWFETGNHIVGSLARLWVELGVDYIESAANVFLEEFDFVSEVFAGFADGSFAGGGDWVPDEDWVATTRPWYVAAKANPSEIVATTPYVSYIGGRRVVTSISKWVPDLGGTEAVVGVVITMDSILDMINEYRLAGGGHLILLGSEGEVVSHPQSEFTIGHEETIYIENLPGGEFLRSIIETYDGGIIEFDDHIHGSAYLMMFRLYATGWTLAAVIPTAAVMEPVSQYLSIIMLASGAVVVALLLLTMFFMFLLTRNKETEHVAHQRLHAMLNSSPLACVLIDEAFNIQEVNDVGVKLFGVESADVFIDRFFDLSPEDQPDGKPSYQKMLDNLHFCLEVGKANFEWMHQTLDGAISLPCEVTLERLTIDTRDLVIAYIRDLREIYKTVAMVSQLENAAFTDSLTGARNRRYFLDEAERELKKCIEDKQDFALLMIDVDHFKSINDTYGHPMGDEVLKILVARIVHSLKHDTLVARYGGEEFIVTLPGASPENAFATAERIRKNIEAFKFVTKERKIDVRISLGVASMPEQGITLAEMVSNADKALYKAKNSGRNKTVAYRQE